MKVVLDVPAPIPFQLVYRLEGPEIAPTSLAQGFRFIYLDSAAAGIRHFGSLTKRYGRIGAVKATLKLASRSRSLYLVTQEDSVVSEGWCTVGRC